MAYVPVTFPFHGIRRSLEELVQELDVKIHEDGYEVFLFE
jgi:hypothetical protein